MKVMPINGFRRGIPAQDAGPLSRFCRLRPVWTHRSLWADQFAPRHIEVGQGEQGEELGGVLGQASISYLAIAPQVLDDPKGMFDLALTRLLLRLNDRSAQLRRLPRFALRCPRQVTPSD